MTKTDADKEAVLLTLDQLSQTMDVMRQVVSRLKRSVEEAETTQVPQHLAATRQPRIAEHDGKTRAHGLEQPGLEQPEAVPEVENSASPVLH